VTEVSRDQAAAELAAYANHSLPPARRDQITLHLRSCPTCAADLDAWQTIATAVRADAAASDLPADRALAAVWSAIDTPAATGGANTHGGAGGDAVVRRLDPGGRRARRWPRQVATRVAAAAVLLLVVMAVLPREGDDNEQLLLTAATRTGQAGTALVDLRGEAAFALGADSSEELDGAPTVRADIAGDGKVVFGRRLRTRLTVSADDLPQGDAADRRRVDRVTVGSDRYTRQNDGPWARDRDTAEPGALGSALLTPDTPTVLLQSADGPIEDLGTDLVDGQPTRRLGFDVVPGALPNPPGVNLRHRAQVWIGEDGLLRQFRVHAQGPAGRPLPAYWTMTLTVRLHDFGASVRINRPQLPGASG